MTILLCALIISVPVAVIVWVQTADFEAPEEAQITATDSVTTTKAFSVGKKVKEHVPHGYLSHVDYMLSDSEWGLKSPTLIDPDITEIY